MVENETGHADWQGVGESFRSLGRRLKEHAVEAGDAISTANAQAADGVVDQVGAAFTTAVSRLDAATTDPEVGAATREATARLLDAIKFELTGIGPEGPRSPGSGVDTLPPDDGRPSA
jgi:hypothetical protein